MYKMQWLILLLGIIANASASILIKVAAQPPRKFPSLAEPMSLFTNIPLWLGLVFYGIALVLYVLALAKFPLNIAHPILTSGAIAAVAVASALIFKEQFYWTTLLGILFIILGVVLLTTK